MPEHVVAAVTLSKRLAADFGDTQELRRFLRGWLAGAYPAEADAFMDNLPGDPVSPAELSDRIADGLVRRGFAGEALNDALRQRTRRSPPPPPHSPLLWVALIGIVLAIMGVGWVFWPTERRVAVEFPVGVTASAVKFEVTGGTARLDGNSLLLTRDAGVGGGMTCRATMGVRSGWHQEAPSPDPDGYFTLPSHPGEYSLGCSFRKAGYVDGAATVNYTPTEVSPGNELVELRPVAELPR